jgi:hypothetical protein
MAVRILVSPTRLLTRASAVLVAKLCAFTKSGDLELIAANADVALGGRWGRISR